MGMSGWFAVLYEVSPDGGYIDIINTGLGRYATWAEAYMEAEEWARTENLPLDNLGNEKPQQEKTNMSDRPNPIPVKRILDPNEFSEGDTIRAIKGKIKKLFSNIRKGGDGDRRYEFQDGIFVDDEGTEIPICFSKCSQPSSAQGKSVYIRSKKTEHGTKGVTFEINEYEKDGETIRKKLLKITPASDIEYEGGGGGAANTGGGSSSPSQTSGGQQARPRVNIHPKDALRDMMDCHVAIASLVNEKYKDASEAFRQGAVHTLFIEAAKWDLIPDFSKRYTQKVYPPAPKDPSKWKECVVPKGEFEGKTLAEMPDEKLLEMFSYYDSKESNTDFAECVYQAARDRNILPRPEPEKGQDPDLDPPPEDDIPF